MSYRKQLVAVALIATLLLSAVGPVTAHSWQTTVSQGPMELGISSSPETPVAGMTSEFSARIKDNQTEQGDADRLEWGGVTNKSVEVHVRGPDGYHDHVKTTIPEEDAHFHFAYVFPTDGTYTISVVTEIEGKEYAFQFQKNVTLLPAKATGSEMENVSSDVQTVKDDVNAVDQDVQKLQNQVTDLQTQVETLQKQLEEQKSQDEAEQSQSSVSGFGIAVAGVGIVASFLLGRRL